MNHKFHTLAFGLLLMLPFASCGAQSIFGLAGNGNVLSSERSVSAFSAIDSGGSARVNVRKGPVHRVVVTTDQNLQELFEASVVGGRLRLGFKPGTAVRRVTELVVDVYMPGLEALSISGSGDAVLMDRFSGAAFKAAVSGSGSIEGALRYDSAVVDISGSGHARLAGEAGALTLNLSGSGSFDGGGLAVRDALVRISGSGKAAVNATDSLEARVSGSASVLYYGEPALKTAVSGSGAVRKASS